MNAHRAVNVALLMGAITVSIVVGHDYLQERDAALHASAYTIGFNTASASISEKAVTDRVCMAFWFGGDSKRVATALQKVKLGQ